MFPFSSDNAYDSVAYDPVKATCMLSELEAEAEAEEPTNHHACSRALQLQFDNKIVFETTTIQFHWIVSDRVISGIGILLPTPLV